MKGPEFMRMNGTRALVTGAASGIGKAVAAKLHEEGAEVFAADIAFLEPTPASRSRLTHVHLDVTDPDDWMRVVERTGALDALVACAGLSDSRSIAETGLDDWRRVMTVNLDAAFLSVKYGAMAMRDRPSGSIVLIGSASGVKAVPQAGAYCASKAGVRMLARVAALELKPQGIRVNCVSPAGVVTPMWQKMPFWKTLVEKHGSERAAWDALGGADPNTISIQRMAFPEEIAEAVVFLCCCQSAHITGTDLAIDGGYTAC
jgi:NAD(P)-dependent dehydrogenase (short-subunit alcohol dehydrogenase family)